MKHTDLTLHKMKRSHFEMSYATLKVIIRSRGLTKTQTVYRINSTFSRTTALLDRLMDRKLIAKCERDGQEIFVSTELGFKLFALIEEALGIMGEVRKLTYENTEVASPIG